jgi:leucyl aminopeptidase (aminopeptidase T)
MSKLDRAAERAVGQSLKLRRGEDFLLITDVQKLEIAQALAFWAQKAGAETTTYLLTESLRPITTPPRLLQEVARRASAIAYVLESRIEEKPLRSFLVKTGREFGRILMMPGLTREMMERLVDIDYQELRRFTAKVIRAIRDAEEITVENPAGTSLRFSVQGRTWVASTGDISRRGSHGNLPAGECYTAPVERSFSGRLVFSLIDEHPGRGVMDFEAGRLVRWEGRGVKAVISTIGADETGRMIGEFGIGTNRGARVRPNMLEAEKAYGTAHFAIGDSYGLGKNCSPFHYDALVDRVTIRAEGKTIVKEGNFLL